MSAPSHRPVLPFASSPSTFRFGNSGGGGVPGGSSMTSYTSTAATNHSRSRGGAAETKSPGSHTRGSVKEHRGGRGGWRGGGGRGAAIDSPRSSPHNSHDQFRGARNTRGGGSGSSQPQPERSFRGGGSRMFRGGRGGAGRGQGPSSGAEADDELHGSPRGIADTHESTSLLGSISVFGSTTNNNNNNNNTRRSAVFSAGAGVLTPAASTPVLGSASQSSALFPSTITSGLYGTSLPQNKAPHSFSASTSTGFSTNSNSINVNNVISGAPSTSTSPRMGSQAVFSAPSSSPSAAVANDGSSRDPNARPSSGWMSFRFPDPSPSGTAAPSFSSTPSPTAPLLRPTVEPKVTSSIAVTSAFHAASSLSRSAQSPTVATARFSLPEPLTSFPSATPANPPRATAFQAATTLPGAHALSRPPSTPPAATSHSPWMNTPNPRSPFPKVTSSAFRSNSAAPTPSDVPTWTESNTPPPRQHGAGAFLSTPSLDEALRTNVFQAIASAEPAVRSACHELVGSLLKRGPLLRGRQQRMSDHTEGGAGAGEGGHLEVFPGGVRMAVAPFKRSAAGIIESPDDIRTVLALEKSMHFLVQHFLRSAKRQNQISPTFQDHPGLLEGHWSTPYATSLLWEKPEEVWFYLWNRFRGIRRAWVPQLPSANHYLRRSPHGSTNKTVSSSKHRTSSRPAEPHRHGYHRDPDPTERNDHDEEVEEAQDEEDDDLDIDEDAEMEDRNDDEEEAVFSDAASEVTNSAANALSREGGSASESDDDEGAPPPFTRDAAKGESTAFEDGHNHRLLPEAPLFRENQRRFRWLEFMVAALYFGSAAWCRTPSGCRSYLESKKNFLDSISQCFSELTGWYRTQKSRHRHAEMLSILLLKLGLKQDKKIENNTTFCSMSEVILQNSSKFYQPEKPSESVELALVYRELEYHPQLVRTKPVRAALRLLHAWAAHDYIGFLALCHAGVPLFDEDQPSAQQHLDEEEAEEDTIKGSTEDGRAGGHHASGHLHLTPLQKAVVFQSFTYARFRVVLDLLLPNYTLYGKLRLTDAVPLSTLAKLLVMEEPHCELFLEELGLSNYLENRRAVPEVALQVFSSLPRRQLADPSSSSSMVRRDEESCVLRLTQSSTHFDSLITPELTEQWTGAQPDLFLPTFPELFGFRPWNTHPEWSQRTPKTEAEKLRDEHYPIDWMALLEPYCPPYTAELASYPLEDASEFPWFSEIYRDRRAALQRYWKRKAQSSHLSTAGEDESNAEEEDDDDDPALEAWELESVETRPSLLDEGFEESAESDSVTDDKEGDLRDAAGPPDKDKEDASLHEAHPGDAWEGNTAASNHGAVEGDADDDFPARWAQVESCFASVNSLLSRLRENPLYSEPPLVPTSAGHPEHDEEENGATSAAHEEETSDHHEGLQEDQETEDDEASEAPQEEEEREEEEEEPYLDEEAMWSEEETEDKQEGECESEEEQDPMEEEYPSQIPAPAATASTSSHAAASTAASVPLPSPSRRNAEGESSSVGIHRVLIEEVTDAVLESEVGLPSPSTGPLLCPDHHRLTVSTTLSRLALPQPPIQEPRTPDVYTPIPSPASPAEDVTSEVQLVPDTFPPLSHTREGSGDRSSFHGGPSDATTTGASFRQRAIPETSWTASKTSCAVLAPFPGVGADAETPWQTTHSRLKRRRSSISPEGPSARLEDLPHEGHNEETRLSMHTYAPQWYTAAELRVLRRRTQESVKAFRKIEQELRDPHMHHDEELTNATHTSRPEQEELLQQLAGEAEAALQVYQAALERAVTASASPSETAAGGEPIGGILNLIF